MQREGLNMVEFFNTANIVEEFDLNISPSFMSGFIIWNLNEQPKLFLI